MSFIRTLNIIPAYDLRADGRGMHGCEIWASVADERGATVISFYTNWYTPKVQKEWFAEKYIFPHFELQPRGAYLGYHLRERYEKGQKRVKKCEYVGGTACFDGGGSFLRAHEFEEPFLNGGSNGLFKALEEEHERYFRER